jgi:hypothetical protein
VIFPKVPALEDSGMQEQGREEEAGDTVKGTGTIARKAAPASPGTAGDLKQRVQGTR